MKKIAIGLSIAYILFVSIFALDSQSFVELFMHLIPSFILIAILLLAIKKPKIGALLFLLIGIGFTVFFKTYNELILFMFLTVPLLVISFLFYKSHENK